MHVPSSFLLHDFRKHGADTAIRSLFYILVFYSFYDSTIIYRVPPTLECKQWLA
jgi:hypothetical protein